MAEVAGAIEGSGVPVLVNTGFKVGNAAELLRYADGAIVGSSLKVDGVTSISRPQKGWVPST